MSAAEKIQATTIKAERACVGSLMLHGNYESVSQHVSVIDFDDPTMARAFAVIGASQMDGVNTFDSIVMEDIFDRAGLPKDLKQRLLPFVTQQPDTHYAKLVRKLSYLRRVRASALQLMDASDDPDASIDDIRCIFSDGVTLTKDSLEDVVTVRTGAFDMLNQRVHQGEAVVIESGLEQLDMFGGIANGEMVVLGGYTGHGKSALALQFAFNIATTGKHVFVISLEMTVEQFVARMAVAYGGLSPIAMRSMLFEEEERDKIRDFADLPANSNIHIRNPESGLGMDAIARSIHAAVEFGRADLVVVDHIGLIKSKGKSIYERTTNTSNKLKQLAINHKVPILALSQLNGRDENVVPTLSSLRDSGAIEQDADQVWLLHRPDKGRHATLYVGKNRQGMLGEFDLTYNGQRYSFDPVEIHDDDWKTATQNNASAENTERGYVD